MPVATLRIPRQKFDSPAQLAFAHNLSYNPWHSVPEHRPLGNQNRGRFKIYQELSRLRQTMNKTPHREPTGERKFQLALFKKRARAGSPPIAAMSFSLTQRHT